MRRAVLLVLLAALAFARIAQGERVQRGNLIVSLDGSYAPLTLPRDRKAPVSVHLVAGLQTADRSILPRVTRVELGIPGQGAITTRGLPTCTPRRLRNTTTEKALELCRPALIGSGRMVAQVKIPHQDPFMVHARLLAFNGKVKGHRAVIVHGLSARPPTVVALPFLIELRPGKFGTVLVAHLPRNLGPWPRFAHFEMDLFRRYTYRGRHRSYLSASCPLPKILTAGFFSFAKATFTLADGRRIGTGIARSCRARGSRIRGPLGLLVFQFVAYPLALASLEAAVLDSCADGDEWPAQVARGIYAGVDYAIAHPEVVETLATEAPAGADTLRRYETVIGRLTGFLRANAPSDSRLPGSTDEALVAGVVGLVGDHLRIGRVDRLRELRPELVLLTLLPYLGFAEAQRWANREIE